MKYGYNSIGVWPVSENRKPTKIYSRWSSLMSRCYNPKNQAYSRYGGNGVTVCKEWHDFQVFAQWFSDNSVEGYVMDKDLMGGRYYSPSTVIFVPDQINQILKCYENPMTGVCRSTRTWFVRTVDCEGVQHIKGKFNSPEEASEYYQEYLRAKMSILVSRSEIPAAAAERLLSPVIL